MSETETHIGTLTPVKQEANESLQDVALEILKIKGVTLFDRGSDFIELFREECYDDYALIDKKFYQVKTKKTSCGDDIYHARKNDDGTIDFVVQFYNGGFTLEEALEEAVK